MYDKCYFCLDQLPKLKKESTASFFVNFGRSRGTKEPTYITVHIKNRAQDQFVSIFKLFTFVSLLVLSTLFLPLTFAFSSNIAAVVKT